MRYEVSTLKYHLLSILILSRSWYSVGNYSVTVYNFIEKCKYLDFINIFSTDNLKFPIIKLNFIINSGT